jgi:hypothetical protein
MNITSQIRRRILRNYDVSVTDAQAIAELACTTIADVLVEKGGGKLVGVGTFRVRPGSRIRQMIAFTPERTLADRLVHSRAQTMTEPQGGAR